jgi:hypothetical protein
MTGFAGSAALIVLIGAADADVTGAQRADPERACDQASRPSAWLRSDHRAVDILRRHHPSAAAYHDPAPVRLVGAAMPAVSGEAQERSVLIAGGTLRRGGLRAGVFSADSTWIDPAAEPDGQDPVLRVWLSRWLHCRIGITMDASAVSSSFELDHATLDIGAGARRLWAGRRTVGWSPVGGGGLVLNRLDRFDGGGIMLSSNGSAASIGPWSGELFAGRVPRSGRVARPWLLGMRAHVRLHERFDAGVTRAAVFGGVDGAGISPFTILGVLAGTNLSRTHVDDQVASIDARWRPPTLPVELYGEWGMHDVDPGVLIHVPAFTVGVRTLAKSGSGGIATALEHTHIAAACCENPPWYHHFDLSNGWTVDGALLGHPLGGQGREWRIALDGATSHSPILLHAAATLRSRGPENLLAPVRAGRSLAFEARADGRLSRSTGARAEIFVERGTGWRELRARIAARWHR